MSLHDLVRHADYWTWRLRADDAASMSRLPLTTNHQFLEAHAARRFTPANFHLVREEIEKMDGFVVVDTLPTMSSPDVKIYLLAPKQEAAAGEPFVVQWCDRGGALGTDDMDDGKMAVTCSCRKMESDRLPCRHILRVITHRGVSRMADCFMPRRHRRNLEAKLERVEEMKELSSKVFDLASDDAGEFEDVMGFMERFLEERRLDAAWEPKCRGHVGVDTDDDEGDSPSTKKIKLSDE